MKDKIRISLTSLFLFASSALFAQQYVLDHGHAEVKGNAPASSYTGVSNELEGKINSYSKVLSFKFRLQSLDTKNDKRNEHMFKALNVSDYPYATFEGKITSAFKIQNTGVQQVTAKGKFTIHGMSKDIEVKGTLEASNQQLKLNVSFPINITEYGMERPHILAYKVDDKHTISVAGTLHTQTSASVNK